MFSCSKAEAKLQLLLPCQMLTPSVPVTSPSPITGPPAARITDTEQHCFIAIYTWVHLLQGGEGVRPLLEAIQTGFTGWKPHKNHLSPPQGSPEWEVSWGVAGGLSHSFQSLLWTSRCNCKQIFDSLMFGAGNPYQSSMAKFNSYFQSSQSTLFLQLFELTPSKYSWTLYAASRKNLMIFLDLNPQTLVDW